MKKRIVRDTPTAEASIDSINTIATIDTTSSTGVLESAQASESKSKAARPARKQRALPAGGGTRHFVALPAEEHGSSRQAELFYLQKQIQLQTQMVLILEDGTRIQGVIEWYDRNSIKVRGKSRVLIYKAAIKYIYKAGDPGSPTAV